MDKINVKMVEFFDQHFYKCVYTPTDDEGNPKDEEITEYIPSVTSKLQIIEKPFLATWRGDIGNREADLRMVESQDRGSRLHLAWQVFTQGGAVVFNDYKKPAYTQQEIVDLEAKFSHIAILRNQGEMYDMMKLQKFLDIIKPTNTFSEMTVYDLVNKDAGTVDNLFEIAEGNYAISGVKPIHLIAGWYVYDLKTGKSAGDTARMQASAYARIVKSMGTIEPIGCIIGHTGATTKGGIAGFSADVFFEEEIAEEYQSYRLAADLWLRKNGNKKPVVMEIPTLIFKEAK